MLSYIAQSGDLDRCHGCLTDGLTLKDKATQLPIKYKSGALVTQFELVINLQVGLWAVWLWPWTFSLDGKPRRWIDYVFVCLIEFYPSALEIHQNQNSSTHMRQQNNHHSSDIPESLDTMPQLQQKWHKEYYWGSRTEDFIKLLFLPNKFIK